MRITIEIPDQTATSAPSWHAFELLVASAVLGCGANDRAARRDFVLVRITREDGGAAYRAHGAYTFELRNGNVGRIVTEAR